MRISGRLMLLLAIPLVALLGVTGYGVVYGAGRSAEAAQLEARTELGRVAHDLVAELQLERAALLSDGRSTRELRESIIRTHEMLQASAKDIGGRVAAMAEPVGRRVAGLERIASADLGGRVALHQYSMAIADLLDLASAAADPAGTIDDSAASSVDYLARARAASAEEQDMLTVLRSEGSIDAKAFQQLTALASAQERYASLAASSSSEHPALQVRIDRVGHALRAADVTRREAFSSEDASAARRLDKEWRDGLVGRTAELGVLQADAQKIAGAEVDELARRSRVLLAGAGISAVAIVLISVYLLQRAIRTIARPLQDLAVQAEDVARSRLPDAVRAQQEHGREELHLPALRATGAAEVREVAAAFNEVQDTALRLAGEQAALRLNQAEAMTNLGRRNQTLLARQLDFITSLEERETDPAFLEHLFKLDHLASRMRRNAESLLILAGSETPRRRRTPAPVTEVIRAAMSEVEEFERVRIGHLRDATVNGPAVIDLVHLLAELIENALSFSPPQRTVEIDGRSLGQGGYQFAIIDHGVGMSDIELLAANERMSGKDELEGMPTRYLGQYVVAKLASKLGAMVRLQPSSGGRGVTAVVNLPSTAMYGTPDRSSVAKPLPGSRASREQGPVPFAPGAGVSEAARMAATPAATSVHGEAWSDIEFPTVGAPVATEETGGAGDETEDAGSLFEPFEIPEPGTIPQSEESHPEDGGSTDDGSPQLWEWESFEQETFERDLVDGEMVDQEDAPSSPPPAPPEVPEQVDWSPSGFHSEFSGFRSESSGFQSELKEEEPVAADPDPDPDFDTDSDPERWHEREEQPDTGSRVGTGTGGLTRRVPGASLAARQRNTLLYDGAPKVERSASGVQSMLASFRAGRHRAEAAAGDDPISDAPTSDERDWRSTT